MTCEDRTEKLLADVAVLHERTTETHDAVQRLDTFLRNGLSAKVTTLATQVKVQWWVIASGVACVVALAWAVIEGVVVAAQ